MHTGVLASSSSMLAPLNTHTDHEAEQILQAVTKLARVILLPYSVVSGLRDVGRHAPQDAVG
jgi:hypothetical protein